jgi:hypothetical protein
MSTQARGTTKGLLDAAGGLTAGLPRRRHLSAVIGGVVGALIVWLYAFGSSPALAQATQLRAANASAHRAVVSAAHKRHRSAKKEHWPACKPKLPKFDVCDSPTQGLKMGGVQDTVKDLLLSFAKDQLKGFILNQFGVNEMTDPVGTKLTQITNQLSDITTQLTHMQTSINNTYTVGVDTHLDTELTPLVDYAGHVFTLYRDKFLPAVRAEIAYADAQKAAVKDGSTCDATPTCVALRKAFEGDPANPVTYPGTRAKFLAAQGSAPYLGLFRDIHNYLVPTGGRSSVITLFGTFLMAHSNGFLTRTTSDRLMAFYQYFADVEALATWMQGEWEAVESIDNHQPEQFQDFLVEAITGDANATPAVQSLSEKELKFLPRLIPAHAIISLSPNAAERTTTKDRPMWLYDPQYALANLSWRPTKQALLDGRVAFEDTNPFSVGHALKLIDDARPGDFSDWTVPTWDEFKGLFAGWNTTEPIRVFIGNMDPTDAYWHSLLPLILSTQDERLWTQTPATVNSTCLPSRTVMHLHVATAVNTGGPLSGYSGALDTMGPGAELYGSGVSDCYDHAFAILNGGITGRSVPTGQLIVVRHTGTVNYMGEQ